MAQIDTWNYFCWTWKRQRGSSELILKERYSVHLIGAAQVLYIIPAAGRPAAGVARGPWVVRVEASRSGGVPAPGWGEGGLWY